MPGEHFCTVCEENLRKHKDTYQKIKWNNYTKGKTKVAVVCPSCRGHDEKLDTALTTLYELIVKEPVKRGNTCTLCGESIKRREKSLEVQFREDDDEVIGKVCAKCLEIHPELNDIKVRFPNPTFKATVTCQVTDECDTYKKPSRNRGINCQHIVCNMDGDLYCRRAHPGHLKMYREKYAFPPSMKRMRKVMTKFLPVMEKIAELTDDEAIKALFPETARQKQEVASPILFPVKFTETSIQSRKDEYKQEPICQTCGTPTIAGLCLVCGLPTI